MWRPDHALLAAQLSARFGIPLVGRLLPSSGAYPSFELAPLDCNSSEAFRVVIRTRWRSLEMRFEPGAYAGELVAQMGDLSPAQHVSFLRLAQKCVDLRAKISLTINGIDVEPLKPGTWPNEWKRVTIGLEKSPASVNTEQDGANDAELLEWVGRFLGLIFAIVPIEETEAAPSESLMGLPEGALRRLEVNRYERSRLNRAACIELRGSRCLACGFSFGEAYGDIGEGFIQIHHVTPIASIGPNYIIDPLTDLVPLCSNCHSIAHRRDPPLTADEIAALITNNLSS